MRAAEPGHAIPGALVFSLLREEPIRAKLLLVGGVFYAAFVVTVVIYAPQRGIRRRDGAPLRALNLPFIARRRLAVH